MPKFLAPIDLTDNELRNVKLQHWSTAGRPTALQGRLGYNTTLDCPEWNNGVTWLPLLPTGIGSPEGAATAANDGGASENALSNSLWAALYADYFQSSFPVAGVDTLVVRQQSSVGWGPSAGVVIGAFEGILDGVARRSCGFASDAPLKLQVTGKGASGVLEITGTGGVDLGWGAVPTYSINITALSVAPSDIALTDDYILLGNESNVASAVPRSTIPLDAWGASTGNISLGGNKITNLADPVADTDAANKQWTLSVIALGNVPKTPAFVVMTSSLFGTSAYSYAAGPRRLIANSSVVFPTIDGQAVTTSAGSNRVLLVGETGANEKYNGLWELTTAGVNGSVAWVLTRGTEEDTDSEVTTGIAYYVTSGSSQAGTEWTLATTGTIVLDTTPLVFKQTGGNTAYEAGNGMVRSGTVFHFGQSGGYTANRIPYTTGATSIGFISEGSAYQSLRVPGGGGAPAFGAIDISQSAATTGTLPGNRGGTGWSSYTVGDILFANGASSLGKLTAVATGNVLISGGAALAPSWGKVNLGGSGASHIIGTLPVGNGGTGAITFGNGLLVGNGASAISAITTASEGFIMVTQAGGVPALVQPSAAGDVTIAATGTMTIGNSKVTYAKMQEVTGPIFVGRVSGTGVLESISKASAKGMLDLTGSNSGDQTVTLQGDITGATGSGANIVIETAIGNNKVTTAKINDGAVTNGKIADGTIERGKHAHAAGWSVVGRSASGSGVLADITGSAVGQVVRIGPDSTLAFGQLNLASANAVTGILGTVNGGTGTNVALIFPTVAGQVAGVAKFGINPGSTSYNITSPFGSTDVDVSVWNAAGEQVYPDVSRSGSTITVTFGQAAAVAYRVVVSGNNAA